MERPTQKLLSVPGVLESGESLVKMLQKVLCGEGRPEQEELALRMVDPTFVLAVATAMGKTDVIFNGAERGAVAGEKYGTLCPDCKTVIGPDQTHQMATNAVRPTCAVFHNKWLEDLDQSEAIRIEKDVTLWRHRIIEAFWTLFEPSAVVVDPDSNTLKINLESLAALGWHLERQVKPGVVTHG